MNVLTLAFDPSPYRAGAASRFGGIRDSFNRPSWNVPISSALSNDRVNGVLVVRVGGRRSRSSPGPVGSSADFPYVSARSPAKNSTGIGRTVGGPRL
ncbi:hypothetical protein ACFVT1_08915 [Streptomyces sp. NPDC057963]|uniref:hypothetical protein n=1 Tax=Streptomyces sp. NPDC057963 TaxID=3346290 RepID=UPI0036EF64A1